MLGNIGRYIIIEYRRLLTLAVIPVTDVSRADCGGNPRSVLADLKSANLATGRILPVGGRVWFVTMRRVVPASAGMTLNGRGGSGFA